MPSSATASSAARTAVVRPVRKTRAGELADITGRLHNTALQRVDRCAAAHGLVVYVPFVNPEVVDYALRIPVELKIRDGVEKWILRQALEGLLPPPVLNRPKAKFWQGAGVGELLARYADGTISDGDFARERKLDNGWELAGKEELAAPSNTIHDSLARFQEQTAFLPDYGFRTPDQPEGEVQAAESEAAEAWPGISAGTSVSGIIGGVMVLILAGCIGLVLRRFSHST